MGLEKATLSTPSNPYPYFTDSSGNGNYNLYLICNGSLGDKDTKPELIYPEPQLLNDLFTTRGVPQSDFFQGNGIWSTITRQKVDSSC
jgi:hypothetical protein